MRKLLPFLFCFFALMSSASVVPDPVVLPPSGKITWLMTFSVRWGHYDLEIIDGDQVTLTKDGRTVAIYEVIAKYVPEENPTAELDKWKLDIVLEKLQTKTGHYVLTIPAATVNVIIEGEKIPNEEIVMEYDIVERDTYELPQPYSFPPQGDVEEGISEIRLAWPQRRLEQYAGLNYNKILGYSTMTGEPFIEWEPDPLTVTLNGKEIAVETGFDWFAYEDITQGWDGTIFVITPQFEEESAGELLITIPERYMRVNDLDEGTQETSEIILRYNIIGDQSQDEEAGIECVAIADILAPSNLVYNIRGQLIGRSLTPAEINSLPRALYIINGKKVKIN